MAAAAEAAFLQLIARRDGVSVGGPEVGHAALKKRPQSGSSAFRDPSSVPQGPPGAALRKMSGTDSKSKLKIPSGQVAAANALALAIQAAWRAHKRHQVQQNSWAARVKRAAEERERQKARLAWQQQEAQTEALRKAYLAEEARLEREARLRAERAAEAERLEAERAAAEAAAAAAAAEAAAHEARERAEQEKLAAARAAEAAAQEAAAARLAAAEREIARLAAERSAAVARVRRATEARALGAIRRAASQHVRRRHERADAASGSIARAFLGARARRQLASRRVEAMARALLRRKAHARVERELLSWVRRRRALERRRAAAATAIASTHRRRSCECVWRRQRRAAVVIAAAWRLHSTRSHAAIAICGAARAMLERRRRHAASRRVGVAWRARRRRLSALDALRRERELRALSLEHRRRSDAACTRIGGSFRRLIARRRAEKLRAEAAAEAEARRVAFIRDNAAAARIGSVWATRLQRRRLANQRRSAVVIQAQVRGYIERERCPLLVGGKTAFDFPRRLEECSLDFPARSTKLSAKSKAELAFVITALKRQKTLKLRVCGRTTHTEPQPVGLARAQTVVEYLTTKGVLKQQLRPEASPPTFGEHGESSAGFVVVQSMFLPKRLSFEPNSSELPPSAPPMLEKVVNTLAAIPGLDLVLEGHCDAQEEGAMELSARRAASVKRWLADNGLGGTKVKVGTVAVGRACPVSSNLTYQGRRNNRRVEIQIRPKD